MFLMSGSLAKAMSVYYLVVALSKEDTDKGISVGTYQNGREQGLTLCSGVGAKSTVYIAEARRTDQIVVYCGRGSTQSLPDEETYQNGHWFGTVDAAANYVVDTLGIGF